VQRLEHHRQRDRAAVRVRDDAVVLGCAPAVHLGHHERNPVLEAIGGRLVDRDRAARDGVGHELARERGSDREQAHVEVARAERLG
jgi:hypothetical protein